MKILTVVGARPEFIQVSPVTRAIRRSHEEILVHTGQHYDSNMSDVFFRDLDIPEPDINLGVGSGSHAAQTGEMMAELEKVMLQEHPDWVVVFGDTNSTLAAALTAAKIHIPLAHIEAGLRSYDRAMPEEINRVVTDHISNLLFAPTATGVENLKREGITEGVCWVGDVRVDLLAGFVERTRSFRHALLHQFQLADGQPFALTTIHRASNTDNGARLSHIVSILNTAQIPIVLPIHPRLRKMMDAHGLTFSDNVRMCDPLGFVDMIALLDACEVVITDSGGLQKEAYMLDRPTITLRSTTEWIETVQAGWNRLCEPEPVAFRQAFQTAIQQRPATHPDFYGTVGVSERIVEALQNHLR